MPRKFIKRLLPDHQRIRDHQHLRFFGTLLHDPNLWHLNRNSVAGAMAVGLFMAFIPIPFQMVFAAALAIFFRVNLPIAAALVWLTNPFTMPPIFFLTYKLGAWLLDTEAVPLVFAPTFEWLMTEMGTVWKPFLLGSVLVACASAALGYFASHLIWRLHILQRIKERRARFKSRREQQRHP